VLARRTLDLLSAEAIIALQVLIAMRAGKLEIAHGPTLAGRRKSTMPRFQNPEPRL
jgi:hypothetical protein